MSDAAAAPAASPTTTTAAPKVSSDNMLEALAANRMRQPAAAPKQPATTEPSQSDALFDTDSYDDGSGDDNALDASTEVQPDAEQVQDMLEEMFHGRKGREILEAIKKGELPVELLAQLKGIAKVNGEDHPVTFDEALKGYMRTSDYTRSKQEAAQDRKRSKEMMETVTGLIKSWDSPEELRAGMKRLGKQDAFHKAAEQYAQEYWRNEQLRQSNPQAYALQQQLEQEREARAMAEQQVRRQPDPQREQHRQEVQQQLNTLVPAAFERLGIKDTSFAQEAFGKHVQALKGTGLDLAEIVNQAAQATAEDLSDLARRFAETNKPAAPKPAGGPTRAQAAPPAVASSPKPQQGKRTVADLEDTMMSRFRR